MISNIKIRTGRFYTKNNPFLHKIFRKWLDLADKDKRHTILEPFAGAGHIISMLKEGLTLKNSFAAYDIYPKAEYISKRDTLKDFPKGFKIAITNPPYLAKNSATRKGIKLELEGFDDLYKVCLKRMLNNTDFVAAIIPESFITSGLFHNRLYAVISLNNNMFDDTDCPVCLALWKKDNTKDFKVFIGNTFIDNYSNIKKKDVLNINTPSVNISFNSINGQIGLRGIDNSKEPSIFFCKPDLIHKKYIKPTSRALTRIFIEGIDGHKIDQIIQKANQIINEFREDTGDIFLTSFKGLRKDGKYRRRLDFKRARKILQIAIERSL